MNAKAGIFFGVVLLCLVLLPTATQAQAQGAVGPLQEPYHVGGLVNAMARAGSLVFFTTFFPTYPGEYGTSFDRTDGTDQGTFSIDPRGSATDGQDAPIQLVNSLGNLHFFIAARNSDLQERGLWRSDGTVAGTFPVTQGLQLGSGSNGAEPPFFLPVPGRGLFFSASPRSTGNDFELWVTDGTLAGTRLVEDLNPGGSSNPRRMVAFDGRLFFIADTPQGRGLWSSDGTPEGTERVHDFPLEGSANIELVPARGVLFLVEIRQSGVQSGVKVWRSDGTETGTEPVFDLPVQLRGHRAAGSRLFLVLGNADKDELWAAGAAGEAVRVLQFVEGLPSYLLAVGDSVTFAMADDRGLEPWWSDGTPQGTRRVADVCPGPCDSILTAPHFAGTYRGRAVLRLSDGVSGAEPWLTDGTAAGTWRLGDLCPEECSSAVQVQEVNGWLALESGDTFWISDGSRDAAWSAGSLDDFMTVTGWLPLPDRLLVALSDDPNGFMASLPVNAPAPMPGPWMESAGVPGFRFKVQLDGKLGRQESACMPQTLCVSGAVPGRSEVFLRVAGPRPNGRLWPAMVKLTPAAADVWVLQTSTGSLRYYRLEGSGANSSSLAGTLDREGFLSAPTGLGAVAEEAKAPKDPQPPGRWIESKGVPGFRVQARLTSNGKKQMLRKEPCIAETFCLSGATPGVPDLLVRVSGPRPNKHYWTMTARFAPATLEVWIQQGKKGKVRYYRLNAPPAGSSQLDGTLDRLGFKK